MLPLLSPEEKFMVGVIQENKKLLEDLKKEVFVPAPELMERIDSSHMTEEMKEHLDRQFGIADKPESASFTLEDVMASVPLRKMYMKDMIDSHMTEEMKEHLDRQFGIADKPESASFTLEDVMASVPLRKMYMKDMIEMN